MSATKQNKFAITVQEPWASYILSGQKTVEGRLNRGKFATAHVGDTVTLNDHTTFTIVAKNQYPTFRAMLESEGLANVLPGVASLDDGVQVYYQFYTPEEEQEFGVVGLEFVRL